MSIARRLTLLFRVKANKMLDDYTGKSAALGDRCRGAVLAHHDDRAVPSNAR